MSQDKTRKPRLSFTVEQKLEYAKLMVVEGYNTRQVMDISGAGATAVARWKKQYEQELKGHTPEGKKAFTEEQKRIQDLEKQLWRAKRDNEILKKATALLAQDTQRIKLITRMNKANTDYSVTELCVAFNVKHSTYYYHQQNLDNPKVLRMITTLKATSIETNNAYGKRRMLKVLLEQGHKLGIYKTARLMKKANVVAIRPKKKHYYPDSGEAHQKAPNVLNRQFNPGTVNTHWVGDITYIRTHIGWSYLACVLDLGTCEVVGWAMSQQPNAELAIKALKNAIQKQQPDTTKLLFHSDQGVQYSAHCFVDYLNLFGVTQSMSRRGNCWDNSVMERFFRSLKTERLNPLSFLNHESAVQIIEQYIHFYNYKRLHSTLGYITPALKKIELMNAA